MLDFDELDKNTAGRHDEPLTPQLGQGQGQEQGQGRGRGTTTAEFRKRNLHSQGNFNKEYLSRKTA